MKKLLRSFLFALCALLALPAFAADYTDWWWDPAQNGMGFNIDQQGNTVAVAWYHFDSNRKSTYLVLAGELKNGQVSGALDRVTGPEPGPGYSANAVQHSSPGNATITFHGDNRATFAYNYDGKSGSIDLERFIFAVPETRGVYHGWWWDPEQSGMGVNIGHQGNTGAAAWYHFGSDGKATFLMFTGPVEDSRISAEMYRVSGPEPGPDYSKGKIEYEYPGEATITFSSNDRAVFTYNYEGKSGSINLQRFIFGTPAPAAPGSLGGKWVGSIKETHDNCSGGVPSILEAGAGTLEIVDHNNGYYAIKAISVHYDVHLTATAPNQYTGSGTATVGSDTGPIQTFLLTYGADNSISFSASSSSIGSGCASVEGATLLRQ
ncbi:MAG: hypothetical protein LBP86_06435 [Azoarcus sp.]|jgi:hypothetical protein|nr:hypothetical protein [Azoarcus sp.]